MSYNKRMAIYPVSWNQPLPAQCRDGALTIGNFDGVHRGHQALLEELRRQADLVAGPAVAMTFDPPPSLLLRPGFVPEAADNAGGSDNVNATAWR